MTIAVIGGTGGMGKTLIRFFRFNKVVAKAIGRATPKPLLDLRKADIIVLSLPSKSLPYAVKLLSEVDLSKKLVISLGSIMSYDKRALKDVSAPILHLHQLFGPKVFPFVGQRVAVAGATEHPSSKFVIGLLKKGGVSIKSLKVNEHDMLMASVQALSQFSVIALAKALSESGNTVQELDEVASVTFKMNKDIIRRILAQKAELWAFLQFENTFALKMIEKHLMNVQMMLKMAKGKDYKKFERIFNKTANYWKYK